MFIFNMAFLCTYSCSNHPWTKVFSIFADTYGVLFFKQDSGLCDTAKKSKSCRTSLNKLVQVNHPWTKLFFIFADNYGVFVILSKIRACAMLQIHRKVVGHP